MTIFKFIIIVVVSSLSVYPNSTDNIVIHSEEFLFDIKKNIVSTPQNYKVSHKDLHISGKNLQYSFQKKLISLMQPVTIKYKQYLGTAKKAYYSLPESKVTLMGNPTINDTSSNDILKANTITIDLPKNKLISSGKTRITFSKPL